MHVSLAKDLVIPTGGRATPLDVDIEIGWSSASILGHGVDLNMSAIVTGRLGRALSDAHFVYYNNSLSPDGAVRHLGDHRVGSDHDRETIQVELGLSSSSVHSVVFVASVHDTGHDHNFGQVADARARLVETATGRELSRFDLAEDAATARAVVFGEMSRSRVGWSFISTGRSFPGLAAVLEEYGVHFS